MEDIGNKFRSGAKSMTSVGIDAKAYAKAQMDKFKELWIKINGEESWTQNPFVWVVEFEVLSTTGKPESLKQIN